MAVFLYVFQMSSHEPRLNTSIRYMLLCLSVSICVLSIECLAKLLDLRRRRDYMDAVVEIRWHRSPPLN